MLWSVSSTCSLDCSSHPSSSGTGRLLLWRHSYWWYSWRHQGGNRGGSPGNVPRKVSSLSWRYGEVQLVVTFRLKKIRPGSGCWKNCSCEILWDMGSRGSRSGGKKYKTYAAILDDHLFLPRTTYIARRKVFCELWFCPRGEVLSHDAPTKAGLVRKNWYKEDNRQGKFWARDPPSYPPPPPPHPQTGKNGTRGEVYCLVLLDESLSCAINFYTGFFDDAFWKYIRTIITGQHFRFSGSKFSFFLAKLDDLDPVDGWAWRPVSFILFNLPN